MAQEQDFHVFQQSTLRRENGGYPARKTSPIISSRLKSLGQHGERIIPLGPLLEEVEKVMEDQHARGQVLKLTEDDARTQFPGLVIASLEAQREEKPGNHSQSPVRRLEWDICQSADGHS